MGPVGCGGGCVGGARGLGALGWWWCRAAWPADDGAVVAAATAAAVLAWMAAEVCWARGASRGAPLGAVVGGGGVVAVVEAVSMCWCVKLIHRARMGSRKADGRRDAEGRSSRAERKSDLLIAAASLRGVRRSGTAGLRSFAREGALKDLLARLLAAAYWRQLSALSALRGAPAPNPVNVESLSLNLRPTGQDNFDCKCPVIEVHHAESVMSFSFAQNNTGLHTHMSGVTLWMVAQAVLTWVQPHHFTTYLPRYLGTYCGKPISTRFLYVIS